MKQQEQKKKRRTYDSKFEYNFMMHFIPFYNEAFSVQFPTSEKGIHLLVQHFCQYKQNNPHSKLNTIWAQFDQKLRDLQNSDSVYGVMDQRTSFSYKFFNDNVLVHHSVQWEEHDYHRMDTEAHRIMMLKVDRLLGDASSFKDARKQIIDEVINNLKLDDWIHPKKKAEDRIRKYVDDEKQSWLNDPQILQQIVNQKNTQDNKNQSNQVQQNIKILQIKQENQQIVDTSSFVENAKQPQFGDLFPSSQQQQKMEFNVYQHNSSSDSEGSNLDNFNFDEQKQDSSKNLVKGEPVHVEATPIVQQVEVQIPKGKIFNPMNSIGEIQPVYKNQIINNPDMMSNASLTVMSVQQKIAQNATYPDNMFPPVDQDPTSMDQLNMMNFMSDTERK